MISRNKRNIGKAVRRISDNPFYHNREGKVIGFRGDCFKGVPFVWFYDNRSKCTYPVRGDHLMKI